MDTLIRVDADLTRICQSQGSSGLQPLTEKIARQPLPRFELDHFAKPGLRGIEDQKTAGNEPEGQKLVGEGREISPLDRIVKGPVPGIEGDLRHRGGADHGNGRNGKQHEAVASLRGPEGVEKRMELTNQVAEALPFRGRLRESCGSGSCSLA